MILREAADSAEINRKQEALAHIKSDFDGVTPNFKFICDSLKIFTDIWNEVNLRLLSLVVLLLLTVMFVP